MVLGYPGSTNRYKTSFGVQYTMDVTNAIRVQIREAKLNIAKDYMSTSQRANIQYAAKYARSSNYYKYSIGQNEGLRKLHVIEGKQATEKQFTDWVNANPERIKKYGGALDLIKKSYTNLDDEKAYEYMVEGMVRGPEIFYFAYRTRPLYDALKAGKKQRQDKPDQRTR
jgi:hypothetical protein